MRHLHRVARILTCMLREIFDEAAYARFLKRTGSTASRASYAAFCRERECAPVRPTRCC
jgi:hypothetical protein